MGNEGQVIKRVGATGQISLGKEFAGRQVVIEQVADGRWIITEVLIIPKHEQAFHTPAAKASAERAAAWLAKNPVKVTTDADLDALEKELTGGQGKARKLAKKRVAKR